MSADRGRLPRDESGFTLPELLLALFIGTLLVLVASTAFTVASRVLFDDERSVTARTDSAVDAFFAESYFPRDVQSADENAWVSFTATDCAGVPSTDDDDMVEPAPCPGGSPLVVFERRRIDGLTEYSNIVAYRSSRVGTSWRLVRETYGERIVPDETCVDEEEDIGCIRAAIAYGGPTSTAVVADTLGVAPVVDCAAPASASWIACDDAIFDTEFLASVRLRLADGTGHATTIVSERRIHG